MTKPLTASQVYDRPGFLVTGWTERVDAKTGTGYADVDARYHPCLIAQRDIGPCPTCMWSTPPGSPTAYFDLKTAGTRVRVQVRELTPKCPSGRFTPAPTPYVGRFLKAGLPNTLVNLAEAPSLSAASRALGIDRKALRGPYQALIARSRTYFPPLPEDIVHLGLDGVACHKKTKTVIGIPQEGGPVLDVLPDKSPEKIAAWLLARPWAANIKHFVIDQDDDLWRGIYTALPDAKIHLDARHVIALIHKRQYQSVRSTLAAATRKRGKRPKKAKPTGKEPINKAKIRAALEVDPFPHARKPNRGGEHGRFIPKGERKPKDKAILDNYRRYRRLVFHTYPRLRLVYRVVRRFLALLYWAKDSEQAKRWFDLWRRSIPRQVSRIFVSFIGQYRPPARKASQNRKTKVWTRQRWAVEFFNYFDDREHKTTGFIEAANRVFKRHVADSRGNPNDDVLRLKMLVAFGALPKALIRTWGDEICLLMQKETCQC